MATKANNDIDDEADDDDWQRMSCPMRAGKLVKLEGLVDFKTTKFKSQDDSS